jgi:DHA1 family bicyclomycin/chloramphenicol resistance-like MFS transporter
MTFARPGSARWVVTLATFTAVTALSIDMSLPAQPAIARALAAGPGATQLTLGLFLLGIALGQLMVGPLSDAFGRKRVLVAGMVLFALAGAACTVAGTIQALLLARFVQGLAGAVGSVVPRAMVRDTHDTADAARLLATMISVLAAAPMVAPSIGALLISHASWRAVFAALAGFGVVCALLAAFTLDETLPPARRRPWRPSDIPTGLLRFLRTPGTRLPTLVACAAFAGQFAWISTSPFVLIEWYGLSPRVYGYCFGATAVALMLSAALGGRLLRHGVRPQRLLLTGVTLLAVAGLSLPVTIRSFGTAGLLGPVIGYFLGLGLSGPSATALAMAPLPGQAGTASAAIGFLQMSAGALSGYVITRLGGRDPAALAVAMALMGTLAAVAALLVCRQDADKGDKGARITSPEPP